MSPPSSIKTNFIAHEFQTDDCPSTGVTCQTLKLKHYKLVTATAERSFSALRLLKTYLRATMHEEHLNGLALMAIHKDIKLNYDDVIEQYALEHNRRLPFI